MIELAFVQYYVLTFRRINCNKCIYFAFWNHFYRRSCQQTLEAKVSPVLAGIIAYLDTNDNLSILEDMDTAWKQDIWLLFLNTSDAISLQVIN